MFDYFDSISILVMPTDTCNMNCKYCYHEAHFDKSAGMSNEMLYHLFKITIPFYKRVHFIWHGGEPLIMGLPFFEKVVEYEKEVNCDVQCRVTNGIQSNLTLMTNEFADFFAENNFRIGTSFDGICNDITRGNTDKILQGRRLVLDKGLNCGCIMVVSSYNINSLIDSYHYFNKNQINFKISRFINTDKTEMSNSMEISSDLFANKVNQLFDEWLNNVDNVIHISPFINIIDFVLFGIKRECRHTSCLGRWLGVRHDGRITNCNRYYFPQYEYGNIMDYDNIRQAFNSSGFDLLLSESIERRNKCKEQCDVFDYCSGGCNNVAMFENGIKNNEGPSCVSERLIYYHIRDSINRIVNEGDDSSLKRINPLVCNVIRKYKKK